MIEIICKEDLYTYNVYHITKAFFAAESVSQKVDPESEYVLHISFSDGNVIKLFDGELELPSDRKQRKYMVDCWLYD